MQVFGDFVTVLTGFPIKFKMQMGQFSIHNKFLSLFFFYTKIQFTKLFFASIQINSIRVCETRKNSIRFSTLKF